MDAMEGLFDVLESIKGEAIELGIVGGSAVVGLGAASFLTGFAKPYLEKVPTVGKYLGMAAPVLPIAVGLAVLKYRPRQNGPQRDAMTGLAMGMAAYGLGTLARTALQSFAVTAPAAKYLPNLNGLSDAILPSGYAFPALPGQYGSGISGGPVSIEELNGAPVTVETINGASNPMSYFPAAATLQ